MEANNFYLDRHLAQTNPFGMGIEIVRAEGAYLYDEKGKAYLDMISGLGVSAIGHGNASVKQAVMEQMDKHAHVMVYGEFVQRAQVEFAQRLSATLPPKLDTCYFVNSGTEANEAAIKLAKRVTGRSKVVSFKGAYHGSTHGSMSVSYNESKKAAFRPLLPEVYFIGLNEHKDLALIDSSTAGVILETIQGDAGVRVPSQEYMSALRQRCDEVGAQLIFDEVQVGLGRTGKMWAFEHYDVIPDILTLGKALGGGLPIGAMITSKENMALFTHDPVLGHITTFGGNPVVCAAANASLEYLVDKVNLDEVNRKGQALHQFFKEMTGVKEVRSKGLFFAVDLESAELVQEVVESCLNKGLITFWFLSCPNAFRLAPPLNLTWKELEKAKTILKSVFVNIVGEKG